MFRFSTRRFNDRNNYDRIQYTQSKLKIGRSARIKSKLIGLKHTTHLEKKVQSFHF